MERGRAKKSNLCWVGNGVDGTSPAESTNKK